MQLAGGIAAVAAGTCWAVKAVAILLTGRQPALLFELAPLLMALAVLALAWQLPAGRCRRISVGAATMALLGGVVVLLDQALPVGDVAYGVAMGGANLLVLLGLVVAGNLLRRMGDTLPLALGLVTVPAIVAGGLVSTVAGDRALEVPLVMLGMVWTVLGVRLAHGRYSSR